MWKIIEKNQRESEWNKRQELKSKFLGMLEDFYYYFIYLKRLVQILSMLLGVSCVSVLIIFQDRSIQCLLKEEKAAHS